jgi:hypothetical protein
MEAKFGPFVKKMKTFDIGRDEIVQKSSSRCTLFDHKRIEEILDELKVEADADKLRRYETYWLRHVTGGNSSRMAGTVLNGRGRLGKPLKRLSGAAETGLSRPDC